MTLQPFTAKSDLADLQTGFSQISVSHVRSFPVLSKIQYNFSFIIPYITAISLQKTGKKRLR